MADLPEDEGWVEGVRAIEETDPVRFDVYNESLSALASRTKYLQENMGQGGAGTEVNVQTGTAYTLVLTDAFKMVTMDNAGTNTLTVPPNTAVAFPANTRIDLGQDGAGQTTIVAGAGVTIRTPETLKLRKQWSKASLIRRAANVWDLVGDLEAAT